MFYIAYSLAVSLFILVLAIGLQKGLWILGLWVW